jgi:hypothetical protein
LSPLGKEWVGRDHLGRGWTPQKGERRKWTLEGFSEASGYRKSCIGKVLRGR